MEKCLIVGFCVSDGAELSCVLFQVFLSIKHYTMFWVFQCLILSTSEGTALMTCITGKSPGECNGDNNAQQMENSTNQPMLRNEANEQSENCCTNGLCSHEILHDGETDSHAKAVHNKMMRKVIFLLWPRLIRCLVCFNYLFNCTLGSQHHMFGWEPASPGNTIPSVDVLLEPRKYSS